MEIGTLMVESKIYKFGIFSNKGILILKNKGIKIGELWVTPMHIY